MSKLQKLILVLLIAGAAAYFKFAFFKGEAPVPPEQSTTVENVVPEQPTENFNSPKSYVTVYFVGENANKESVYKIVKRVYNAKKDGTKISYAVKCLLKGPTKSEKAKGIYSEIPQGTKMLSLEQTPEKITINLNDNFEQGGGTDTIYKSLYQLIKTVNKNTALDVYLNINGKQVEVLGGDGIMINQPLNDDSIGE